jgi:hypothetical protein
MESIKGWITTRDFIVLTVSALVLFPVFSVLQVLTAKAGITTEQYSLTWLSFSAKKIVELNQLMIEKGTFHYYILAHFLDFFFMTSFAVFFYTLFTIVSQRSSARGFFAKNNRTLALFAIGEAVFDSIETSLVFISTVHPRVVPGWLPVAQGIPNIIKLLFFYSVLLWSIFLICCGAVKLGRIAVDSLRAKLDRA